MYVKPIAGRGTRGFPKRQPASLVNPPQTARRRLSHVTLDPHPQRRELPRAATNPSLHHGETIAAPKRFAIDEDPRGAEHAARNRSFAMLARDSLDFGIAYAR